MIVKIKNFFNVVESYFTQRILLDKNELNFINFNKKKWIKKSSSNKGVILIDLFPWYPFIYFWSYLSNILSIRYNLRIKYYYFDFYQTRGSKVALYISKLKKIFKSFNAEKGIVEYDFKWSLKDKKLFQKKLSKIKKKSDLINYKIDNIKIGDLIYGQYLRSTLEPTLNINDQKFKKLFFRANKIYFELKNYFLKNNIKFLIPSHVCYISYGIITRLALSKNIPVIKLRTENRGNSSFRLMQIDKYAVDEPKYYNYKKNFNKLNHNEQKNGLIIGKKILLRRISGRFDPTLPYIFKSQFKNENYFFSGLNHKKKKNYNFSSLLL